MDCQCPNPSRKPRKLAYELRALTSTGYCGCHCPRDTGKREKENGCLLRGFGASEALSVKFQRFKFQAIVTIVAYFAIVIRINVRNNTPAIQRLR
jgi:hypothetical protein